MLAAAAPQPEAERGEAEEAADAEEDLVAPRAEEAGAAGGLAPAFAPSRRPTVTVTPLANQSGTTTVTVTVSDGTATASDTFTVEVRAVNDPPTISDIANQGISEDANTGPLAFTVGDAETAATSLTVTASSSNTALVPNANVVLGGTGASRTVTVTPLAGHGPTCPIPTSVAWRNLSWDPLPSIA